MVLDGLMSVASALGMGPQAATRTTGLRPTPPLTKPKATSMPPEAQPSLSSPKSPAGGLVPGNKNRMNNLTCPFCASAACFIDRSMAPGAYYVRCGQCCATGPTFDTEDEAISAWENLLNRLDRKTILRPRWLRVSDTHYKTLLKPSTGKPDKKGLPLNKRIQSSR